MLNHDKSAPPLYAQLESILKKKIEDEEYKKGDLLPAEKILMEQYQVSRITVRQAMAALCQAGYIKSSRGIGTKVIFEKIDEHMRSVISFTDEMKQHNITMNTSYCTMEKIRPTEKVAMMLKIPVSDECYCLTRVRCVEDRPLVYTKTYLKDIVELPIDSQYYMESLYRYLEEVHGLRIVKGQDTLETALPTQEIQSFLEIEPHIPIFIRTRQTCLADNEVFEYSICYYPGNRYKYTIEL